MLESDILGPAGSSWIMDHIHQCRVDTDGGWYMIRFENVPGIGFLNIKGHGNWIQRFETRNICDSGPMDSNVKDMHYWLRDMLIRAGIEDFSNLPEKAPRLRKSNN